MGEFFINPWFLAGAAGAALPLLIHLLVRRRVRRVRWAAMELLLKAFRKTNRRLRLENWLLLFLRMLAVALIALSLARPVVRGSGVVAKIGEKNRAVFLLLDSSYSMGYKRGRTTPFEAAKKAAADVLATLRPGADTASLLLVSSLPEVVYGEPTPELDKVKQALGETQPGFGVSDLGLGLDRLLEIMALPAVARMPNKEVVFFTDGQRLAWVQGAQGGTAELTKKLAALARSVESFTVLVAGDEEAANLSVTGIEAEDRVVGLDKHTGFTVRVANHGTQSEDVYVEFLVDGNAWSSTHLTIPARETQSARFGPVFRTAGAHWVSARIGADSLDTDNEQFYALRVREQIRVLIVDGEPASESGGGLFAGETAHLELAFLPVEGLSIIQPQVVRHFELSSTLFARGWDLIVLANEGRTLPMDPELLDALDQYVRGGGALLVFLGDRVRAEDYNEHLFRDGQGLLPLRLGKVLGNPTEPKALAIPQTRHPVLAVFEGKDLTAMLTQPLTRTHFVLETPDPLPEGVGVVARFEDGETAIAEKTVERGRVMVVATSADMEWTDLPGQGIFLPLVHEMAYYLVREDVKRRNLAVGDALERPLTRAEYAEDLSIVLPGGGRVALEPPREIREGFFLASFGPLSDPGAYELQLRKGAEGDGVHVRDLFSANVDASEGDLTRASEEFIQGLVPPDLVEKFNISREGFRPSAAKAPGGSEVWKPLLALLLGVLVLETVLARRFGDFAR